MSGRLDLTKMRYGTELLKRGFAKMQEGGVVMDVVTPEEAHIAEDAGAVSVMALERVPADIRAMGGVARMSHPDMIKEIMETTMKMVGVLVVLNVEEVLKHALI